MATRTIVGLGVRPAECKIAPVEVEDDWKALADWIGCDLIDETSRFVEDTVYEFIVDDEGLCKDSPVPATIDREGIPGLAGNILVFAYKDDPENGRMLESLHEGDFDLLMRHAVIAGWGKANDPERQLIAVLKDVDYSPEDSE